MSFLRRRNHGADANGSEDEGVLQIHKSRKPPNTAFRQQRLKAWQPILTPKTVIPLLFLMAAVFAPLGAVLIWATYNVENLSIDYTRCSQEALSLYRDVPSKYTNWHFRHKNSNPNFKWRLETQDSETKCFVTFELPHDINPPIFLYYRLTNFFQNHRKYVESYDIAQIGGKSVSASDLTSNCDPLRKRDGKAIYPCGLIANSLFNDTFSSPVLLNTKSGSTNETYELSSDDISWSSDREHRFKKTTYKASEVVPPPNWVKLYPDGYTDDNLPDISQMQHLQNWMRTAALPTFLKLYLKNTTATFSSGTYEMEIGLNYPVSIYGGTKSLLITTNSVLGGRNMSLGIIYVVVAVICLTCAVAFFLQYLIKPRRIGDHNFLQGAGREGPAMREQL